jgi:hypothetical protein
MSLFTLTLTSNLVIPPQYQERFVSGSILGSIQPSHGIGNLNFGPDTLGIRRLSYAYP